MPRKDTKPKHKYGLRSQDRRRAAEEKSRQRRRGDRSDSSDDESSSNEEEEFDLKEYRQFLSKIFPSKFMEQRAAETPGKRRRHREKSVSPTPPERKKKRRTGRSRYSDEDVEEDDEEDEDYVEEEEEEEEEGDDEDEMCEPTNVNVILTIGGVGNEDEDEDDEDDEDEECSEDEDEDEMEEGEICDTPENRKHVEDIRKLLPQLEAEQGKDSKVAAAIRDTLNGIEQDFDKKKQRKEKKIRTDNTKKFASMLKEKNMLNDTKFFKEKLSVAEQAKVLNELEAVMQHCHIDKPYRLTLLDTDIPPEYKAVAYKKINTLKYMEPGGGEYYKIKQWVDTFMQVPFGKYKSLPVTLHADGPPKCAEFMEAAKDTLDGAVYGMNDVKLQIMQMIGQWITNPSAMGTAIAIKGPMGTGKTTIVKEGISKVLGRDFAFLALGGATDSSFLEGHSYTYEGSTWGKIVDILVQCKSMNPVIFLDELDKVSDTPKGEELIGILTHLTDTSQNSKFHDKYFAELDFDLSRALFIFSYNDESKVNPILRDRMYRVQTKGYETKEKIVIAEKYLLPKIREQVKFEEGEIIIPEATMRHIIEHHTEKEQGVRNLKRCLEIIYTKLNLYRLMRPGTNLFEKEMALAVEFPMTITTEVVDKLIKTQKEGGPWQNMYI